MQVCAQSQHEAAELICWLKGKEREKVAAFASCGVAVSCSAGCANAATPSGQIGKPLAPLLSGARWRRSGCADVRSCLDRRHLLIGPPAACSAVRRQAALRPDQAARPPTPGASPPGCPPASCDFFWPSVLECVIRLSTVGASPPGCPHGSRCMKQPEAVDNPSTG